MVDVVKVIVVVKNYYYHVYHECHACHEKLTSRSRQQTHGFIKWQANDIGIGAGNPRDEGLSIALYAIAAGFAFPFFACDIISDLFVA